MGVYAGCDLMLTKNKTHPVSCAFAIFLVPICDELTRPVATFTINHATPWGALKLTFEPAGDMQALATPPSLPELYETRQQLSLKRCTSALAHFIGIPLLTSFTMRT